MEVSATESVWEAWRRDVGAGGKKGDWGGAV